ncbi:MAG: ssDNA-binding protein [Planctomycetota bacterium]
MSLVVKGRYIGGAIYEPKETSNGVKFNACVVLEDGEAAKVKAARDAAIKEKFGTKKPAGLQDWTVRQGDDEEYEHSYEQDFINPKAKGDKRIPILRKTNGEMEETDDVYPGCYVHLSIDVYAYPGDKAKDIKPGVSCGLRAVMFWKDGEAIGNRFDESEFAESESEDAESFGAAETSSLI